MLVFISNLVTVILSFSLLSSSVVQAVPGQPAAMSHPGDQASGGDGPRNAGCCDAQNHGCVGTLCQ